MAIAKDAAQQLYRSVYAILNGDSELATLLNSSPTSPKIFQTFIDYQSATALKEDQWVTYGIVNDQSFDVEQLQDIREILLDVHVWVRGPGSDIAESIDKRVRELLDNADLSTVSLLSWYCHASSYSKTFEAQPQMWHVTSTFRIMCMAVE